MPWEQPLQQILNSIQGPVAKIIADVQDTILREIADCKRKPKDWPQPHHYLCADLRMDSLEVVELVMTIEETWDLEIHNRDLYFLQTGTVQGLITYVEAQLKGRT